MEPRDTDYLFLVDKLFVSHQILRIRRPRCRDVDAGRNECKTAAGVYLPERVSLYPSADGVISNCPYKSDCVVRGYILSAVA
jgi:hypothetical protein